MFTEYDLYFITTKTSLHPGAGRSEFSTIDHQVQRDYRGLPFIRKSSMKGALREYLNNFEHKGHIFGGNNAKVNQLNRFIDDFEKNNSDADTATIAKIKKALNKQTNQQITAGHFSFHDASLFSIPVRSNVTPFFNVTSENILQHFMDSLKTFATNSHTEDLMKEIQSLLDLKKREPADNLVLWGITSNNNKIYLDEFEKTAKKINSIVANEDFPIVKNWTKNNLIIAKDDDFKVFVDDFHLPIIPRNYIVKGESKNLWYEQVLPPETRLYNFIGTQKGEEHLAHFTKQINEKVIGVGANLSVGYGCCYFQNLESLNSKPDETNQ